MKNNFLKLALEEAGLVESANTPELEELVEQQAAEDDEVAEKAAELDAVEEVQEGLEALVSSMEAALADPHYSPREYQLQVSHAATLLGRIGLSLPTGLSCESTDGASDAKDSFADKAKKLGKVAAEYAKKFLAWLKDVLLAAFNRIWLIYNRIEDKLFPLNWIPGVDFEVEGVWEGFEFDPKNPAKGTKEALNFFKKYVALCKSVPNDGETSDKYITGLIDLLDGEKLPFDLKVGNDVTYSAAVTYKGKTSADKISVKDAKAVANDARKIVEDFEKFIKSTTSQTIYRDSRVICGWLRSVCNAEANVAIAYAKASTVTDFKGGKSNKA